MPGSEGRVTLFPDTDTVLCFGVADETGDLGYKEAGEYAFFVTRKDGSQYVFKFDYDPERSPARLIPNIQACKRCVSRNRCIYSRSCYFQVVGNICCVYPGRKAGIYLYFKGSTLIFMRTFLLLSIWSG